MALTPIVNAPNRYMTGLRLAYVSATSINVLEGQARDSTNTNDLGIGTYVSNSETVAATISTAVNGPNGLDKGTVIANARYAVFIIGDSSNYHPVAGLISNSTNLPTLPFGYDIFRRIGFVATDGSANLYKFYQYGRGFYRSYYFDAPISLLSGGSATSFTAITLTASGSYFPPIDSEAYLKISYTPNSATNIAEFLPGSSSASNGIVVFGTGVAGAQQGNIIVPATATSGIATIKYKVATSDSLSVSLVGFRDYLYPPQ